MSDTDFLPRRQSDLRTWTINFNARITADPSAYGVTAAQAADYNAKHDAFMRAFAAAMAPDTRTRPSIETKDEAMGALRKAARQLAAIIHASPGVSDTQKSNLGLTIRRPGGKQTPFPRPRKAPLLDVEALSGSGDRVEVRLRESSESMKRGKPTGVDRAILFMFVGDLPPGDVGQWRYVTMMQRTKRIVKLPRGIEPGTAVWYTACWQNRRGESGPLAKPMCTHRQFGVMTASIPMKKAA